ncbi:MAG: PTS system mannose/fructose/sorbose family transporter subunit IID [Gemmatimonadota bacterium]
MTKRVGVGTLLNVFLRSFLIQGSWNYHSMLGSGFAFAMLPVLKKLYGDDPEALEAAIRRHLDHFNAHPYLSTVALGATIHMELDGEPPEAIRRFKTAVRGPLGGLGDALVWAAWLPAVSLLSMTLYWLSAPVPVVLITFLVLYNLGHLGLRIWGFRIGLQDGRLVGRHLGASKLGRWTQLLSAGGALLVGLLAGSILVTPGGLADAGVLWTLLAAVGMILGDILGHRAWRPAAAIVVSIIVVLAAWGGLQ